MSLSHFRCWYCGARCLGAGPFCEPCIVAAEAEMRRYHREVSPEVWQAEHGATPDGEARS